MIRGPHPVTLPCCNETVKVTTRKSKLSERPRQHDCSKCGARYGIGPDFKPQKR